MAEDKSTTDPQATPAPGTEAEAANPPTATDGGAKEAAQPPVTVVLQQQDKHAEAAANMAAGKALAMDETVPGGIYIVNGQRVNSNGDPVGTSLDKSRT